ncbi:MAG: tetratricopeptide repeat protein [Bacteroidales bacterium]
MKSNIIKSSIIVLLWAWTYSSNIYAQQGFPDKYILDKKVYKDLRFISPGNNIFKDYGLRDNPSLVSNPKTINLMAGRLNDEYINSVYSQVLSPSEEHAEAAYIVSVLVFQFIDTSSLHTALSRISYLDVNEAFLHDGRYLIYIRCDIDNKRFETLNDIIIYYTEKYKQIKIYYPLCPPTTRHFKHVRIPLFSVSEPDTEEKDTTEYTEEVSKKIDSLEMLAYDELEAGRYDESINTYKSIISLEPTNNRAYNNVALMYCQQEKYKEAIDVAKEGLKVLPSDECASIYRVIGNAYICLEDYSSGVSYLSKSVKIKGDDAIALHNLGTAYYFLYQFDKGIYWMNRGIYAGFQGAGSLHSTWFYLGTSLHELGYIEESLEYFDKALEESDYHNYYHNKVQALLSLDRIKEAFETVNIGIERNPDIADLYHDRYQIYRQMGNTIESNKDLLKAYQLNPDDADALQNMGIMYFKNNEIDKALECLHKALKTSENKGDIYNSMANIYGDIELNRDSAEFYYKQAIAINPNQPTYYYNYGNFFRNRKQEDKAIEQYQKAIDLNPNFSLAYNNMGTIYMRKKDFETAKSLFDKVLTFAPNDFSAQSNLAGIAMEEEDFEATDRYTSKALSVLPAGQNKSDILLYRANARQQLGRTRDALYDYLSVTKEFSKDEQKANIDIYTNIAYCYLEMNELDEAEKTFLQVLDNKKDVDAGIGLMLIYYQQGNSKKLKKITRSTISLEPLLKKGMIGIQKLEEEGYFYTDEQKKILKEILEK